MTAKRHGVNINGEEILQIMQNSKDVILKLDDSYVNLVELSEKLPEKNWYIVSDEHIENESTFLQIYRE